MVVVEASCLCELTLLCCPRSTSKTFLPLLSTGVLWILWLACGAFTIVDNDSHLLSALDCDDIPSKYFHRLCGVVVNS